MHIPHQEIIVESIILFAYTATLTASLFNGIFSAIIGATILYFSEKNGYSFYKASMSIYKKAGIEEFYGLIVMLMIALVLGVIVIFRRYLDKDSNDEYDEGKNVILMFIVLLPYYAFFNITFFENLFYYIFFIPVAAIAAYHDMEYTAVQKIAKSKKL